MVVPPWQPCSVSGPWQPRSVFAYSRRGNRVTKRHLQSCTFRYLSDPGSWPCRYSWGHSWGHRTRTPGYTVATPAPQMTQNPVATPAPPQLHKTRFPLSSPRHPLFKLSTLLPINSGANNVSIFTQTRGGADVTQTM